ncbi:LD-carboxypeptidase [Actinocrinis puniceicyclus]|uniref:LD-carboxypeptidase n=1 Tax=Actinocrinis puniceicyclus TaxID=977794 RepID=A0A8J7WP08_9ACTN|nr:LD-carboxypeptidase [Actinocrinis puniceicyclus]MBS2964818.1 LD-carboxypeptidase [Actinocrinis puniceicyclus]
MIATQSRRPPLLPRGGHVRVVSPAAPAIAFSPVRAERARRALTDAGYRVSLGEHAALTTADGQCAGTAEQRASDLMAAFADPEVDAIMAATGGASTRELLPLLDAGFIAGHPKPFVGHCDTAWLNQYLLSEARLTSFYGATFMVTFGEAGGPFPESPDNLHRALGRGDRLTCRPVPTRTRVFHPWSVPKREALPRPREVPGGLTWLRPGRARGPVLCMELSMLTGIVADFGLELDGHVLAWDISPYSDVPMSRTLREAARAVDLSGLAGMIVGPDVRYGLDEWAGMVREAARSAGPLGEGPLVVNADIGHMAPTWVVPYGADAELDAAAGTVEFPRGSDPARETR